MRRLLLSLAAIFLLRADMYPDASNAKLPEAQQNLGIQVAGAKCDGVADDTAAISGAMLAASTAPDGKLSEVVLPKGTCMTGTVPLYTGVNLKGQGINQTILKLKPNTCADVMLGQGAYGLFGSDVGIGIGNFSISEMTIDGNRANQTGCADIDKTSGVVFYGYKPVFRNLVIQNVLGHGMRSEWQLWGTMPGGMDGDIQNLTIINTGRHGWWNNGPHDMHADHLHIANASLEANDTYIGLYEEAKGSGRFFNFHGYVSSGAVTNRPKYQYSASGNSEFVASHFEGGNQQIELRAGITRISNSRIYFPFGTNNALIDIRSSGNMLTNNFYSGISGQANWAVEFGPGGASEFVSQNVVTGYFNDFGTSGPIKFTDDDGDNQINGLGWSSGGAGAAVTGTPLLTTSVCYYQIGTPVLRTCNIQGTHMRINANILSEYLTNAAAELAINFTGYNGGLTQFRTLGIYNGKGGGGAILKFDGPTKHLWVGSGTPVLTACGTSPAIVGSDTAGTITLGTGSPAGCTLTFFAAYTTPPHCTVTWQTNLASMQYVLAAASITLSQTPTSSNKVNYTCFGSAGG